MRVIAGALPVQLLDKVVMVMHVTLEIFESGARPQAGEEQPPEILSYDLFVGQQRLYRLISFFTPFQLYFVVLHYSITLRFNHTIHLFSRFLPTPVAKPPSSGIITAIQAFLFWPTLNRSASLTPRSIFP